jgi:hypothetical protein
MIPKVHRTHQYEEIQATEFFWDHDELHCQSKGPLHCLRHFGLYPSKTPELVGCFGAQQMVCPRILHTDNGKEFTGKVLTKSMKENSPSMVTVTGRPRTPRDQGSVENMTNMLRRQSSTSSKTT